MLGYGWQRLHDERRPSVEASTAALLGLVWSICRAWVTELSLP